MLAVYRPAGIIQRLCVKLKRLATLQFPIAVIQRIAQRKALLFLAVQQPTLCIIEGAGGDTQPLAGQPLTAGVIDGAGVFAVSGPLYSQLPLRRDLAAAIIDILFDAQRRVLRRLQYTFGIIEPVSRQLCILLALYAALRIVKTAAYGPPAPRLPIHPARWRWPAPERLRQRAENTPLPIIQPVAELHVRAAQGIDGAPALSRLAARTCVRLLPVKVPFWLSQPPSASEKAHGRPAPPCGAVGQLASLQRQIAAALQ